jgi:hypothetical protein
MSTNPNVNDDIPIQKLEALKWNAASAEASLTSAYDYVVQLGSSAADWYLEAKRPKQHLAYALRLGAIILTAAAGVIPVIAEVWRNEHGAPKVSPALASVLLIMAATLVFLDQFLGCSSGWIRYVKAYMQIKAVLEQLQFAFAIDRAAWQGNSPAVEQVQRTLANFKSAVAQVDEIVTTETNEWAAEFRSALRQIEDAAKASSQSSKFGAMNLTVTNGDQCANGWSLAINDGTPRSYSGRSAALSQLVPGVCKISVTGRVNGSEKRCERAVQVAAGQVVTIEGTLT